MATIEIPTGKRLCTVYQLLLHTLSENGGREPSEDPFGHDFSFSKKSRISDEPDPRYIDFPGNLLRKSESNYYSPKG